VGRWEPDRTRPYLLGRTNEWFVRSLLQRVAAGADVDDATLTEAGMDAWAMRMGNVTEPVARSIALRRARRALRNPDVQARFNDLFELGGFTVSDAVAAHVAFIRDGNYAALRDYWAMTQGPPARKLDVRTIHIDATPARQSRAISARVLGDENGEANEKG
jgi:hypothetical protein